MEDTTLVALEEALGLGPENDALRAVIASEFLHRGEPGRVLGLFEGRSAAGACAVHLARALLALGRGAEGLPLYEAAVAHDAALEDRTLAAELQAATPAGEPPSERGDNVYRLIAGGAEKSSSEDPMLSAPPRARVTFDDVGGLDAIKKQIHRRIILPFLKPSLFERFRRKAGGGILVYGPPGCGKTLLARATAGECDAQFFNVAISDILDMYIGESEGKLHAIFQKARASRPAVLFFDEIEALGGKRSGHSDPHTLRLVSQFLAEMDGFTQSNQGVLVLGATNLPWAVDAAFRRPGRFDRFVFVPPPDRAAREAILRIHLRDRPVDPRVSAATLASKTSGFSGADLEGLVDAAADVAISAALKDQSERAIIPADFDEALAEIKPTTLEWLTTARNHARYANEGGQYDDVLAFLEKHGRG